jgi:hypothetical protein
VLPVDVQYIEAGQPDLDAIATMLAVHGAN